MSAEPATAAGRSIGAVGATALVAGNMVGSGVFLLPATAAAIGSMALFGWIIVTIGALLLATVFLRLSQIEPDAEMHAHVRRVFGAFPGWQSGFIYWISCVVGNIAIAVAVTGYLAYFFPVLTRPWVGAAMTSGVIMALVGVNFAGAGLVARLSGATLLVGLAPVVLAAIAGWIWFDPTIFMASWNVTGRSMGAALPASLSLLFWAFCGLESASVVAARVRDPGRNVPIATIAGVLVAALVYISACTALTGIEPAHSLATDSAPFARVFARIAGPISGAIVAACALLKASGTLGGWILVTAETARDGAAAGSFPRFLSRTNRNGVPVLNLLSMGAIMITIALLSLAPTLGRQFGVLINASVLFTLVAYIWCCLALIGRDRRWSSRAVALLALAFCLGVIVTTEPSLLAACAATLVVTPPLYFLWRRGGGKRVAADAFSGP